jgi:hypothetical protein
MAGIFKAGQLVTIDERTNSAPITELYSVPGGADDVRVIGRLSPKDVALVIASWHGGTSIYVIGPSGGGWTFGALLKVVPT